MPKANTETLPAPVIDERAAKRLAEALCLAATVHGRQARKGTQIPYISHPMHVAGLVLEHGGSIEQAVAALLHDVIEDCDEITRERLQEAFGCEVAGIVQSCSDTLDGDTADDKSPWAERKVRYIEHLKTASPEALLVSACDKRHNLQALIDDVRRVGIEYLARFNSGPASLVWYYASFAAVAGGRIPPRLADELRDLALEFAQLVDAAHRSAPHAAPQPAGETFAQRFRRICPDIRIVQSVGGEILTGVGTARSTAGEPSAPGPIEDVVAGEGEESSAILARERRKP